MMTPFERVVGDSSKDHTVTAPTFTTRPTTEQLHHYAGRHWPLRMHRGHEPVGVEPRDVVERCDQRVNHVSPIIG